VPAWKTLVETAQGQALATGSCPGAAPTGWVTIDGNTDPTPVESWSHELFVETSQWRGEWYATGSDDYWLYLWLVDRRVIATTCLGGAGHVDYPGEEVHQARDEYRAPRGDVPAVYAWIERVPGAQGAGEVLFIPLGDFGASPYPGLNVAWLRDGTGDAPEGEYFHGGLSDLADEDDGYGWLCLDRRGPIPQPAEPLDCPYSQAADWHGELFLHLEHWPDPARPTRNLYYAIEYADCAVGECAEYIHDEGGHVYLCDGIDNDLDGLVDEGSEDIDGDGIGDCATE
jgi:hypothetical protein